MMAKKPVMKPIRTIQKMLDSLPNDKREEAYSALGCLIDMAPKCQDAPALLAAKQAKEEKLRSAGHALLELPEPFLGVYSGIGKHLLHEADLTKSLIERFPPLGPGRPPGIGKLRFIDLCDEFINNYFPVKMEVIPVNSISGAPRSLLSLAREIRRESIILAMDLWRELDLGKSSFRSWEILIKDGWEIYLDAYREGVFK